MQRRFKTVLPSSGRRQQVSLCTAFVAVFTLAGSITAWALCPFGRVAQKYTGGGACVCSDIDCENTSVRFGWRSSGALHCHSDLSLGFGTTIWDIAQQSTSGGFRAHARVLCLLNRNLLAGVDCGE